MTDDNDQRRIPRPVITDVPELEVGTDFQVAIATSAVRKRSHVASNQARYAKSDKRKAAQKKYYDNLTETQREHIRQAKRDSRAAKRREHREDEVAIALANLPAWPVREGCPGCVGGGPIVWLARTYGTALDYANAGTMAGRQLYIGKVETIGGRTFSEVSNTNWPGWIEPAPKPAPKPKKPARSKPWPGPLPTIVKG